MVFVSLKQINVNIRVNESDLRVRKHYVSNQIIIDNFTEYTVMFWLHKQAY